MKLRVVNTETEADDPSEYLFDQDRVTIGRDSENDLTLPDPQRIVSKEHAVIQKEGGTYQLVDRGSKNFTYLHDQRLTAGEPYELAEGDVFSVGNFEITFVPKGPPSPSPTTDETVFAADFSNPFADPAQNLSEALANLVEAYEQEAPQRREDALKAAFRQTDTELENYKVVERVLDLLGVQPSAMASPPGSPEDTPTPSPSADTPPDTESQKSSSSASASSPSTPSVQAEDEAIDEVLETLLESLSRIIEIPWQFRHEFIGQTIMQSAETDFLYSGDASTMKDHLLDPSISQDERRERLDHVEDAAEALAVHQVAMLNGYKASVTEGAEELLDRLNPEVHQAEITEENVMYEYLPVLASPAVVERLQLKWNDLKRGDWSAAEQRIFRPAFIKAYLARMTAADPSGKDTTGEEEQRPA